MRYKLKLKKTITNSFFGSLSPFSVTSNNYLNENPDTVCIVSLLEIKMSENCTMKFSTNCMISNIMSLTFKVSLDKLIEINKYGIPVYGIASSLDQIIFEMNIGNLALKILREDSNCYICITSVNTEVKFKYSNIISTMLISIIIDYVEFTLCILKEKNQYIEETVKMLDENLKILHLEKIKFEKLPDSQRNSLYMYIFNSTTNEEHLYETELFPSLIVDINSNMGQDNCKISESLFNKRQKISDTESIFSFNVSSISSSTS